DDDLAFTVSLPTAGTGTVTVTALGVTRDVTFRAAAPTEWKSIAFAQYAGCCDGDDSPDVAATSYLQPAVAKLTFPASSHGVATPLAATALLADGTRVLLSSTRVRCGPQGVVLYQAYEGAGTWNGALYIVGSGDATCTIDGHESLGALAVHVD